MKKTLLLCGALLALTAATASAAPAINLAWNDCVDGVSASLNKAFACNTNSGSDIMYVSFVAPGGIDNFLSVEIQGEAASGAAGAMPAWWQLKGTTACRNGALTLNGDFSTNPGTCSADNWTTAAVGGIGAFTTDSPANGRAQFNGVVAVPSANVAPLTADTHYYGVKINLTHTKTLGATACAGCNTPVCIRLKSVNVVQPAGFGNVLIQNVGTRAHVTYQGATDATCELATPTRNSTWGAVKNLYR